MIYFPKACSFYSKPDITVNVVSIKARNMICQKLLKWTSSMMKETLIKYLIYFMTVNLLCQNILNVKKETFKVREKVNGYKDIMYCLVNTWDPLNMLLFMFLMNSILFCSGAGCTWSATESETHFHRNSTFPIKLYFTNPSTQHLPPTAPSKNCQWRLQDRCTNMLFGPVLQNWLINYKHFNVIIKYHFCPLN